MVGKQCLKDSVGEQRGQKVVKEVLGWGGGGGVAKRSKPIRFIFEQFSGYKTFKKLILTRTQRRKW